jgi:putative transposase
MSRYRRADVPGGSYFFTVVTERRQRVLTEPAVRLALREAIEAM